MAQKRLRKGDIVEITFLDHAENSDDALEFIVYGRVMDITRYAYKIGQWIYAKELDRASNGNPDNEDYKTIVKTAITKKRRLVPKNETS